MPYFSICIPNFNLGKFVGQTIQSVLDQTFTDFEVIVVDNDSPDNSWEVINSFGRKDPRIKIFRNNCNIGFAPNLQRTSEKASGKYMIMLSSDDIMYPNALAEYHKVIEAANGEDILLHSALDYINPEGEILQTGIRYAKGHKDYFTSVIKANEIKSEYTDGSSLSIGGLELMRAGILEGKSPSNFLNLCYPRTLWSKIEGYDPKYLSGPDTVFLYKLLATDVRLIYIKQILFGYRIHGTNQLSQDMKSGIIKKQLDKYIFSFSLENTTLSKLNLKRSDLEKSYIKIFCLGEAISSLADGYWVRAIKLYFFGLATYPHHVLKSLKGYICFLLILSGPIGIAGLKALRIYGKKQ